MAQIDPDKASVSELEVLLKKAKDRVAEAKAKEGLKYRKELEAYCQAKYNMSLADIFTASDKAPKPPVKYKNPKTGGIYTYHNRGKKPAWLKGNEDKYQYLNGEGQPAPAENGG